MRDDHRKLAEIVFWEVATRRELRRIGDQGESIQALAFSSDGKVLGTSDSNQAVRFWDVADGREIRRINGAASDGPLTFSAERSVAGDGRRQAHPDDVGSRGQPPSCRARAREVQRGFDRALTRRPNAGRRRHDSRQRRCAFRKARCGSTT